jgi:trans-aconitate methyltransferase
LESPASSEDASAAQYQPSKFAEVGCGAGEILRQLSLQLPATTFSGFDISTDAIALAQTRENERTHFFNMDLRTSPVTFDVLLVMDVVEHIEDCFGFLRSIREKAEYKIIHIPLDMSVSFWSEPSHGHTQECWAHPLFQQTHCPCFT